MRLICGKSRVAPVRQLTIPRLELQGGALGANIAETVITDLSLQKIEKVYWTDSVTVLSWLRSTKCRYHAYVANRVTNILETSNPDQWLHVPGVDNPADDGSRGIMPDQLSSDHRWFNGPRFLWEPPSAWPNRPVIPEPSSDDPEVFTSRWIGQISVTDRFLFDHMNDFSSIARLKRAYARARRYVTIVHHRVDFKRRNAENQSLVVPLKLPSYLLPSELKGAMKSLIRLDQSHYFACEISAN